MTMAERSFTFRIPGTVTWSNAFSHSVATSMLNRHVSGTSVAADHAAELVVRRTIGVRINRRSARLQPNPGRILHFGRRFAQNTS